MASESYKFYGFKRKDLVSTRLVLEDGRELVQGGDPIDLTEEEVKDLRAQGYDLRKSSDDGSAGDEGEGEVKTRAQQQESQVASGAQHPGQTLANDNTPAGREAKGKA